MSKAQELKKLREQRGYVAPTRKFEIIDGAETMESYYGGILTDEEIEQALNQYVDDYDVLTQAFLERTRIQGADLPFLFIAVMLQCARIYIINKITETERANVKGGKEDKLHEFQEKVLGKLSNGEKLIADPLYASLDAIITTRGVPYDATRYAGEKLNLFKGANHRFATLGHDPVLGLVFGTANILTNTISTNKKLLVTTNHVVYDGAVKNPKIAGPVSTTQMLSAAGKRFEDDKKSVVAAVIKQLIHIATDLYTPCGITLPGAGLVLSSSSVEQLTEYISTGDLIKVGASAGTSVLINTIISAVHGCKLLFQSDDEEFSKELYQARTRKIIMYSNVIASSSNVISTVLTKDANNLDIGGLLVTLYRVFNDTRFINKLEYEFLNSGLSKVYEERYAQVAEYFDE